MLRASAAKALRQCRKRDRHPSIHRCIISTRAIGRRGSIQPSSSAAIAANQHLGNRVRCFAGGRNDSSADASRESSLRWNDGAERIGASPLLRINAAASTAASAPNPRLSFSCLDISNDGSSFATFDRRRLFSTRTAKRTATPSPSSDATFVGSDDAAEEEKSEGNPASVAAPKAKDGGKTVGADPAGESKPAKPTASDATGAGERSVLKKSSDALLSVLRSVLAFLLRLPSNSWFYLTHPADLRSKLSELKEHAVTEAHHYWMGTKLLVADVRTARGILLRTLGGSTLSRRERKQLLRTVTDVFRLVPMSVFVLVPFMELALPFAIKMFPTMLPSTFRDTLKEEEKMKGELAMRISMAGFFQDTLASLAKEQKKAAEVRKTQDPANGASDAQSAVEGEAYASASSFLEFLKKARTGEAIPPDVIIKFSKYVEDNLTLDNLGRMQLINLCKYMGIPPYGSNDLLRFYLRHRIRALKDDDQRITWEGIDTLTKTELREACRERGMRSTGLSRDAYETALQEWLELSVHKNVPTSLLIMSRTFYLHDEMVGGDADGPGAIDDGSKGVTGLADVMSGIDREVLNEIVFEMASSEEKSTNVDVRRIQLEILEHQNELIKEEQQERDAAAKEKEEKQKEKKAKVVDEQKDGEASGSDDKSTEEEVIDDKTTFGKDDVDIPTKDVASTTEFDSLASPMSQDVVAKVMNNEEAAILTKDEQTELSTEEINAISQLASPDPLQKEKEELQKIKDAMVEVIKDAMVEVEEPCAATSTEEKQSDNIAVDEDEQQRQQTADASLEMASAISPSELIHTQEALEETLKLIKENEDAIEKEAKEANVMSMDGDTEGKKKEESSSDESAGAGEGVGDVGLQKAIDRLKSRVESMVGKIETQLTDVEAKIGNKFHLLDTDGDGVLTMEEMAQVLQTVLKRELTSEEAMAIAVDIDQNKDGVFSIAELAQWCETNTIVKLAEDGREKDLDDMITERVQEKRRKLKEEDEEWTGM